ncbi:MAG TPA: type VI secretion system tube protein Hcp [Caldimonas sp.]|nr:type VI secretion system tube protein Hcp [Caldimonas sp.]
MAWSNIFLQLTTLVGPIFGEGQAAPPFTGQIELLDFKWDMTAHKNPEAKAGFGLSLTGAASSFLGVGGNEVQINLGKLTFKKRADAASAQIMLALDNKVPVVLASITVLNIQNLVGPVRDPGYNLTVTGGYFSDVSLKLQSSQMGAELVEDVTMNFTGITITYMRKVDAINAHTPTVPFFFKK